MRKTIIIILLILIAGCNNKNNNIENTDENVKEEIKKDEYIDDNPIEIGFYILNNKERILVKEYKSKWTIYKDIQAFTVYASQEDKISNETLKIVWQNLWDKYENISEYKIGYYIKFSINEKVIEKTILKPSDSLEIFSYIQIYLYDDIHQTDSWYSHIEDKDVKEDTMLTTIKITSSQLIDDIISDIELTGFTYKDSNDFDKNGFYIGKSKFKVIIKRDY